MKISDIMKTTILKEAVLASALCTGVTLAFGQPMKPTATTTEPTTTTESKAMTSQQFVTDAAMGNMKEVCLGREAMDRSRNPDVKRFASQIIRDHSACNVKLERIATAEGLTLPATNTFAASDPNWNNPLLKTDETIKGQGAEMLTSTNWPFLSEYQSVQHLKTLSGPAFDQAYVAEMVSDHAQDIAEFENAQKNLTDPKLKQFALETLPALRSHYHMAQELAGKLAATTPASPVKTGAMQSAATPGM